MILLTDLLAALSHTIGVVIMSAWLFVIGLFLIIVGLGMMFSYYFRQRRQSKLWPRMNA